MRPFFSSRFSLLLFIFPREIRFLPVNGRVGIGVAITEGMQTNQSPTAGERTHIITDDEILQHHEKGAVMRRARVELKIVRRLIVALQSAGYTLTIDDGEEQTPVTNQGEALKLLFNLDEARILTKSPALRESFVYLVFGHDGYDVICDYGTSLEAVMGPLNEWINQQEDAGL